MDARNIDKELDNIIDITGEQLDLDREQYGDEIKEGAKEIFSKWLKNYHADLIANPNQGTTISPDRQAKFSTANYN